MAKKPDTTERTARSRPRPVFTRLPESRRFAQAVDYLQIAFDLANPDADPISGGRTASPIFSPSQACNCVKSVLHGMAGSGDSFQQLFKHFDLPSTGFLCFAFTNHELGLRSSTRVKEPDPGLFVTVREAFRKLIEGRRPGKRFQRYLATAEERPWRVDVSLTNERPTWQPVAVERREAKKVEKPESAELEVPPPAREIAAQAKAVLGRLTGVSSAFAAPQGAEDYQALRGALLGISEEFRTVMAAVYQPVFNAVVRVLPKETYKEKQDLCKWVNSDLGALGLAVACPETGSPAALLSDTGTNEKAGRFTFETEQVADDGTVTRKRLRRSMLPEALILVPAKPPSKPGREAAEAVQETIPSLSGARAR